MARQGVTRYGKAKRVKLELPVAQQSRLREPISAEASTVNGQLRTVFYHDPQSKYNWGTPNETYGTVGVEIPKDAVTYHDQDAELTECTFMQPEKIEFFTDRVVVLMPPILVPPRKYSRPVNRKPGQASAEQEQPAAPAQTSPPPLPETGSTGNSLYTLVHQLNQELQKGDRQVQLGLRDGKVVITETCR